jgi:L-fucose mutarotase
MLKGISSILSPDLLKTLCEMGHGDEIVLADANFPGVSIGKRVVRADGLPIDRILEAILPLFVLDTYADPLMMMQVAPGDKLDPAVEADYMQVVRHFRPDAAAPVRIERNAFYERSRHAFCVVMTGELRIYGNLILKKGVIASS